MNTIEPTVDDAIIPCEMCSLLLSLLDKIEIDSEEENIIAIARQRFEIAKSQGLTVEFGCLASGKDQ